MAGCAVEHLIWVSELPELCVSCVSCQLEEQCSQVDPIALAVQRILAADAVVFMVDEANAGEQAPLLPLLQALQQKMATWQAPRFLYVLIPGEKASEATPTELLHGAVADVSLAWSGSEVVGAGTSRNREYMQTLGRQIAGCLQADNALR